LQLQIIGIGKPAFDSHVIASTETPEVVDIGRPGIVRDRHRNHSAGPRSDVENAGVVLNSLDGSFYDIGSWRQRITPRSYGPGSSLDRSFNTNRLDIIAAPRSGPESYQIARFQLLGRITPTVIYDSRGSAVI